MADDNVQVKFTADTSGLDAGILTAKSDLKDLQQALAGGNDWGKEAAAEATQAVRGLSVATSGATREFIVLGHEALSGNFSRIPGSLVVLAERMGGLTLATAGLAAGIGGVAFSLYEMIAGAEESAQELNDVGNRMELAGKSFEANDSYINGLINTLRAIPGVSKSAAASMAGELAGSARLSSQQINFITSNLQKFATLSGQDVPRALKEMASALEAPFSNFQKLDNQLNFLTPSQYESIRNFKEQGETARAAGVIMDALGARLDSVTASTTPLQDATHKLKTSWDDLLSSLGNSGPISWIDETGLPKMIDWISQGINQVRELIIDFEALYALQQKIFSSFSGSSGKDQSAKDLLELNKQLSPTGPVQGPQQQYQEASLQEQQRIKDTMEARQKAAKDAISAKRSEIAQERSLDEQYYAGQAEQIKLSADQKKITWQQEYAELQANLTQQMNAELKTFDQQLALYSKDSAEYKKLQNEKLIATQQFHNEEIKLQIQAQNAQEKSDDKMAADWKKATSGLQSSLTSAFTGMITGGETFTQAMARLFGAMVNEIIGYIVKIGIEWIGVQLGMLPSTKATALATISASAGEAFAAAYAAIAAIPIVGPALAPAAAAEAGTAALSGGVALAAFDIGTPYVPSDGIAMLHRGEAVIPQGTAQRFRDGDLGLGNSQPDVHTHFHISSLDSAGVSKILQKHSNAIGAAVAQAARGGSAPLRAAFNRL